jgi:pimeloyl-ACP methyl ester carboxylesterase
MVWLRPFAAVEPALAAMASDDRVTVTESATQIVMSPVGTASDTAVFFQPGAKVEARAYAAVLRPLAQAGHLVVIPKQPLSIAFLAIGAFGAAQEAHPEVGSWIVGGHSLGGTVASMEADEHDQDARGPARGLLLYASYPASDISQTLTTSVLSILATNDLLATPADIAASQAKLPKGAQFSAIEGAVHAFFGDYGPQPGDGVPTISQDAARQQISSDSVTFAASVGG